MLKDTSTYMHVCNSILSIKLEKTFCDKEYRRLCAIWFLDDWDKNDNSTSMREKMQLTDQPYGRCSLIPLQYCTIRDTTSNKYVHTFVYVNVCASLVMFFVVSQMRNKYSTRLGTRTQTHGHTYAYTYIHTYAIFLKKKTWWYLVTCNWTNIKHLSFLYRFLLMISATLVRSGNVDVFLKYLFSNAFSIVAYPSSYNTKYFRPANNLIYIGDLFGKGGLLRAQKYRLNIQSFINIFDSLPLKLQMEAYIPTQFPTSNRRSIVRPS